jgi:hypothetical protein
MIDLKKAFEALRPHLNEKTRRIVAASLALSGEYGLRSQVSKETGVSFQALSRGLAELEEGTFTENKSGRIRKGGGGRKKLSDNYPKLLESLKQLIKSTTRGNPESPLLWTCKSLRNLARELQNKGFKVSFSTVGVMLGELGYSLHANKKVLKGADHLNRKAQFEFINRRVKAFQKLNQPIISIDCKKHELIDIFNISGREYHEKGAPNKVDVHDFMDKNLGKLISYGIFDLENNTDYVNVDIDHDTLIFTVQSIKNWWLLIGSKAYQNAKKLLIMADFGGRNGYRRKLWKLELSKLAKEINLMVSVCHYPTGTSKWNKIEHRLFSHITMNWRGRPLLSHEVVVNLIGSTKTSAGLTVKSDFDRGEYPNESRVSDDELEAIRVQSANFHGEWNYTFLP